MNKWIKMYARGRLWCFAFLASIFTPSCFCAVRIQVNSRIRERLTQDGCLHLWHPFNFKGVPQTTLNSDNSLEHTNFTLAAMVYSKEKRQMKIRKSFWTKPGRHPNMEFADILSLCAHGQHRPLPAMVCDNMRGMLPSRKAHPSLSVQRFYWVLSHAICIDTTTPTASQPLS